MGKVGFLFSGQGAQKVGMGKDIYEKYETAKKIYDMAEEISKVNIKELSFEGPEEVLKETKNAQLAIVTMELAILEILKENGIKSDMSAGLSLGEYSALVNEGAIKKEEAIDIIKNRGKYMQELCPEGNWKMAAILLLEDSIVEDICSKVTNGFVSVANYNCQNKEIVISGDENGVNQAMEMAKEAGAKRVVELKTSGPFHTKKLEQASIALKEYLKTKTIDIPKGIVIKNVDGTPYSKEDNIKEILADHVMSPTKIAQSIEYMLKNGVDTFIEIGPGKTLTGFVKKIDRSAKYMNINDVQSLENVIGGNSNE